MPKKILVIDDEELIVATLKRLLTKEGHRITTALSGAEALKEIEHGEFDLIISDIKMPDMDGVETVKRIRDYVAKSGSKPIPEIFITAYAKEDIYKEALALNSLAYVEKPFDMKSLLEAVNKAIGK